MARNKKQKPRKIAALLIRVRNVLSLGIVVFLFLPPLQAGLLNFFNPPLTLTMLQRSVEHYHLEGTIQWPNTEWVPISEIPTTAIASAIASEDARFLQHAGFDWRAIEHAWRNRSTAGFSAGGSTISQQVAKNVFLWQNRSWFRKGLEAWYTFWLELFVPKQRIIEVYLNIAETGPMTFGLEAGAQQWFNKPLSEITPEQCASLIALFPAPRSWSPETPHVQQRATRIVREPAPIPDGFGD